MAYSMCVARSFPELFYANKIVCQTANKSYSLWFIIYHTATPSNSRSQIIHNVIPIISSYIQTIISYKPNLIERGIHPPVRRLPVEVIIPQQRRIKSRESAINPRILIRHTPNTDTNTLGDIQACLGDRVVVSLLLGQLCRVNGLRDADVELGDGNIKPSVGETLELRGNTANLAGDEMSLSTNPVDGDTAAAETSNKCDLVYS